MERGIQVPTSRPSPPIRPEPLLISKKVRDSFSMAPHFSHRPRRWAGRAPRRRRAKRRAVRRSRRSGRVWSGRTFATIEAADKRHDEGEDGARILGPLASGSRVHQVEASTMASRISTASRVCRGTTGLRGQIADGLSLRDFESSACSVYTVVARILVSPFVAGRTSTERGRL